MPLAPKVPLSHASSPIAQEVRAIVEALIDRQVGMGSGLSLVLAPTPDGSVRLEVAGLPSYADPLPSRPAKYENLLTAAEARAYCGLAEMSDDVWQRFLRRHGRVKKLCGGQYDRRDLATALEAERTGRSY